MPTFQTPYGTVDAPDLGAAQKWIANQKPAAQAQDTGSAIGAFWHGLTHEAGQTLRGTEQLVNRLSLPAVGAGARAGQQRASQALDTDIARSEQSFQANLETAKYLWASMLGRVGGAIGATAPLMMLPGGTGIVGRIGMGALGGGLAGATQPVTGGNFATEKTHQIGQGAALGGGLGGALGFLGREIRPSPARSLMQDFHAQRVPPSVPVVGQGRGVGMAAEASRLLPASPVAAGMQRTAQGTQQAVERAAAGFGGAANAEQAGGVIQRAMRRMAADKSQAATDYGEFDRLMHGAPPAPATHVLRALNDLYSKFLNNPELDDIFNDPKLSRIRQAVEPHQVTIPAQTSPILSAGGQPIITRAAQTITRGGTLPIQDLKLLRTRIGYLLERPPGVAPAEIPKADLNRVYKALTQDLHAAARARSPAAAKALAVASGNYSMRAATLEALEKVLGKPDEPGVASERFFNRMNSAAQQGGQTNAGLLMRARRMMQPGEWQEIGAATIRRLGVPTAGARDVLADNFSVSSFATNWNKLTPKAKDLLFGADTPGSPRAGLEQLSRIAQAQKNVGKLSNVSHSGEVLGIIRLVEGVMAAVAAGHFPWAVGMGLAGAYGVSKLLMSPGFTRWVYQLPRLAQPAAGGMLPSAALTNAGEALHQALMNPSGPPPAPEPEQRKQAPPQFRIESTNP